MARGIEMNKSNFVKEIRKLKICSELLINHINYGRVIATKMYPKGLKYTLCLFVQLLFFNYKFSHINNRKNILSVYSYSNNNRKDYDEIMENFRAILGKHDELNLVLKPSFKHFFQKIKSLINNYMVYKKHNLEDKLKVAILVSFYSVIEQEINKIMIANKYDLVVTFCDAHHIENLTAQIAMKNNIRTATLQHGQYRFIREGFENGDCEAYENFISDYLLTWGQATVDEFKKFNISEERMLKVGALRKFSNNTFHVKEISTGIFGVILSGETYKESNVSMIELANQIAKEFNMKYILRLHPKNHAVFYESHCDLRYLNTVIQNVENIEYIEQVDFSLVHMTGVFVELLSLGTAIFVFTDEYLEDLFKTSGVNICNIDDFRRHYTNFIKNKDETLLRLKQQYRYFNEGGNIEENYKNAINFIINSKRKNVHV